MNAMKYQIPSMPLRPLLPAPNTDQELITEADVGQKSKGQSVGCAECQKKRIRVSIATGSRPLHCQSANRQKCNGSIACDMCSRSGSTCTFDPSTDKRQKDAFKSAVKAADNYRNVLLVVIKILQGGEETETQALRTKLRHFSTVDGNIDDVQLLFNCSYGETNCPTWH